MTSSNLLTTPYISKDSRGTGEDEEMDEVEPLDECPLENMELVGEVMLIEDDVELEVGVKASAEYRLAGSMSIDAELNMIILSCERVSGKIQGEICKK